MNQTKLKDEEIYQAEDVTPLHETDLNKITVAKQTFLIKYIVNEKTQAGLDSQTRMEQLIRNWSMENLVISLIFLKVFFKNRSKNNNLDKLGY